MQVQSIVGNQSRRSPDLNRDHQATLLSHHQCVASMRALWHESSRCGRCFSTDPAGLPVQRVARSACPAGGTGRAAQGRGPEATPQAVSQVPRPDRSRDEERAQDPCVRSLGQAALYGRVGLVHEPWNVNIHYDLTLDRRVPPAAKSALDVGCGDGFLAGRLARRVPHVVALDIDEPVLGRARSRFPKAPISWRHGEC